MIKEHITLYKDTKRYNSFQKANYISSVEVITENDIKKGLEEVERLNIVPGAVYTNKAGRKATILGYNNKDLFFYKGKLNLILVRLEDQHMNFESRFTVDDLLEYNV